MWVGTRRVSLISSNWTLLIWTPNQSPAIKGRISLDFNHLSSEEGGVDLLVQPIGDFPTRIDYSRHSRLGQRSLAFALPRKSFLASVLTLMIKLNAAKGLAVLKWKVLNLLLHHHGLQVDHSLYCFGIMLSALHAPLIYSPASTRLLTFLTIASLSSLRNASFCC